MIVIASISEERLELSGQPGPEVEKEDSEERLELSGQPGPEVEKEDSDSAPVSWSFICARNVGPSLEYPVTLSLSASSSQGGASTPFAKLPLNPENLPAFRIKATVDRRTN